MLIDVESCYTDFERIALALRVATKKLCPYFKAHTINVLSSYPIKAILHKLDASGRLLKWAIELSEFDIVYRLRLAIKSQVLASFIAELSGVLRDSLLDRLSKLRTDGSSKTIKGKAGMVLLSPEGLLVAQAVKFSFSISNNEARYKAVLLGLLLARTLNHELRASM